ncbi:MAG: hypothetical protein P1U85_02820 [Verrucomicrobiales bacterium]|nr:hypothetical protein [Verrucomicrobiales bacterium]
MKNYHLTLLSLITLTLLVSCGKGEKEDSVSKSDWLPENASVAKHITDVHGFVISPAEDSHLQVTKEEKKITARFRDDVLEELGGEKALYILGWDENPFTVSRHEYLYFLEALHAYLVLNAPQWDGGEGKG